MEVNEYFARNRPQTLDAVVGNESAKAGMRTMFCRGEVPKGTLFYGPSGLGKTSLARITARRAGCTGISSGPDACGRCWNCRNLLDWNSFYSNAATLSIAGLKEIQNLARYKHDVPDIYLIDELHRATDRLQDLLVTMLEDGNANYCIVFCTLYPEKVEAPLLQRLISFEVTPPRTDEMIKRLKGICMRESWQCPDSVLADIAEINENAPRACENALFQWSLTLPVQPGRAA